MTRKKTGNTMSNQTKRDSLPILKDRVSLSPELMILGLLLIFGLLSISSSAQTTGWHQYANYQSSVNITVLNWNYSTNYIGASSITGETTKYAMIALKNITNPTQMSIYGYDSGLNNLGPISYYIVSVANGTTVIMIPSTTEPGLNWKQASIFYNKTTFDTTNNTYNANTSQISAGHNVNFVVVGYNPLATGAFSSGISLFRGLCGGSNYNLCVSSPLSNTSYAFLNGSTTPFQGSDFVIMASNSIIGQKFNVTVYPSPIAKDIINSSNGNVRLTDIDTIKLSAYPYVSNALIQSKNQQILFNETPNYNSGLEIYVNTGSYKEGIITEGMQYARQLFNDHLINSSTTTPYYDFLNDFPYGSFNITANLTTPATFYIMPGFTTDYIVSNTAINPHTVKNITANCTTFSYKALVTNVIFNTTYPTLTPDGSLHILNFGPASTHYLLYNTTHYTHMGNYCQTIGIFSASNPGANSLIPFAINNCSASKISIIMTNTTTTGYSYSSFNIEWGNPTNATTNLANGILLGQWQFKNGFDINATGAGSNGVPFVINLRDIDADI